MVTSRVVTLGFAALTLGAVSAGADVLVLEDGRRIRGELVSVNRGVVLFDQEASGAGRPERISIDLTEVQRITFRDAAAGGRRRGMGGDDRYGRDDGRDGGYGREGGDPRDDRGDDEDDPEGYGDEDAYGSTDVFGTGRDRGDGRDGRVFSVDARRGWTNTGIEIREGDTLRFEASGEITWGPGRRNGVAGHTSSSARDARPVANRPGGALVGRIGNDVFFIGAEDGAFRARSSGPLYLGVNDLNLGDNSGAFTVRVVHPLPE